MSSNKSEDKKEFLISARKSISASITSVPPWIMQKAGKRIYNTKAHRNWRTTDLGTLYKRKLKEQGKSE